MSGRCTIIVPDAGPLNSLWVARRLDLLLILGIPVVVIDAVYDEATGNLQYEKDRDVKEFLDARIGREVVLESTFVGRQARLARASGHFVPKRGMGDAAIAEFMQTGVEQYIADGGVALLLFEDVDIRNIYFGRQPSHLHLLSTVAMLRGLEEGGFIESADRIVQAMLHPTDPLLKKYARKFKDLPAGTDVSAPSGSRWKP